MALPNDVRDNPAICVWKHIPMGLEKQSIADEIWAREPHLSDTKAVNNGGVITPPTYHGEWIRVK